MGNKEIQEFGAYDFGARQYWSDIGRWGVIDGLSDGRPNMTPYRYSFNNPVNATDPSGLWEDWFETDGGMEFRDDVKSQDDLDALGIDGEYKFESGNIGDLYYSSKGTVYDDSPEGGGRAIADGRVQEVQEVQLVGQKKESFLSQMWNSSLARMIFADRYGVTLTADGGAGIEAGASGGIEIITRGKDAGIYIDPFHTVSIGAMFGAGGEESFSFFRSNFTGDVSDITLDSTVGPEVYIKGSVTDILGVTGKVSTTATLSGDRWITTSGGIAAGAKGSIGLGVTFSNTKMGIGIDGELRIADYTGILTKMK
jgi:RHS repeat-associated protein